MRNKILYPGIFKMPPIRKDRKKASGQIMGEYALLVTVIVVGVLLTMSPLIKRSVQHVIKVTADQIGDQKGSDQTIDAYSGYLDSVNAVTDVESIKDRIDYIGQTNFVFNDRTTTITNMLVNMGFQPKRE